MLNVNNQNLLLYLKILVYTALIMHSPKSEAEGPMEIKDSPDSDDEEKFDLKRAEEYMKHFKDSLPLNKSETSNSSLKEYVRIKKSKIPIKDQRHKEKHNDTINCIHCYSSKEDSGGRRRYDSCYYTNNIQIKQCFHPQQCFIEIHPLYISRDCIKPEKLNRKFVCNCPLCNDKSSLDPSFYDYDRIRDWKIHNELLSKPLQNLRNLICKKCDTTETNLRKDLKCRIGEEVNMTLCAQGEYCYTDIKQSHGINRVSRGCIKPPVFNSMFIFCAGPMCNSDEFDDLNSNEFLQERFKTTILTLRKKEYEIIKSIASRDKVVMFLLMLLFLVIIYSHAIFSFVVNNFL